MTNVYVKWALSILVLVLTLAICVYVGKLFGVSSFAFSWVLNFLLMSWYTLVAAILVPSFASGYFRSKPFEKGGKVYTYLGVPLYRKLLVLVGWEKLNKHKNPVKRTFGYKGGERASRNSEADHTISAVIVFATAGLFTHILKEAKWLLLLNVHFNIYPVLMQRYNKPRYSRVLAALQ